MSSAIEQMSHELAQLKQQNNLRSLPSLVHEEREVVLDNRRMLNLSSNDYLGLATDKELRKAFLETLTPETFQPSASSSRLLTGNFTVYDRLETELAHLFGKEAALTFNCGYHANTGILAAVSNAQTLILADKLVHASLIDGIKLSAARSVRYRHNDYAQLERLVQENHEKYERIIVVTESIFSMDGDEADLGALVRLKRSYPCVLLYVDEAHAFGVRGAGGLGCAEEQGCIADIDMLVGTFGKALASMGAYVVCSRTLREYLINKVRPFIFTTALPPVNVAWTLFLLQRLRDFAGLRQHLSLISGRMREALVAKGYACPSTSHIIPWVAGASSEAVALAEAFQRKGFYVLPVRPPTVPEGTSRLRFSLTAAIDTTEIEQLIKTME